MEQTTDPSTDGGPELRTSAAAVRALIDHADCTLWSVDREYRLLACNARFRLDSRAWLGHDIARGETALPGAPEATEAWRGYYERGLRGESFRIVTQSMPPVAPRTMEYHFNPIVASDCQISGVTIWGHDITERKPAEAELWNSEGRYRFLVDRLPAGLLVHGADERVILSNPKACSLLGLTPEDVRDRLAADPAWQFLREDTSPLPVEDYPARRVFATGQAVTNQVVGIRRQEAGSFVWMLAHAFPDLDPQGRVRQAVVMLTDISRRKETEAALQGSEVRYRELYRSAQRQALEMTLLDQVRTVVAGELELATVIRKVVEAIADTFSYPLVSLYLRHGDTMRLQHQVGYEKVIAEVPISRGVLGQVMRTERPVLLRNVHTDPDFLEAEPGIISEACVPLFAGGQSVGALKVAAAGFELTEADLRLLAALGEQIGLALGRARLYAQVREDAATRAILLHEVNHRVKNNLSAIIGLLQLQQDYLPAPTRTQHQPVFNDIISRIRSLAAVHDLLSASSWAPVHIHELAERIVEAAVSIGSSRVDVTVDLPPSPVQVSAKMAGPLALIMNELVTNSLKHALPNTPALRLGLAIERRAGMIELEFRDNGPGFPLAVLSGDQHNVGLHLIRLLSRHDLRGTINLLNDHGAVARLRFAAEGGAALTPAPTGPLSISEPSA